MRNCSKELDPLLVDADLNLTQMTSLKKLASELSSEDRSALIGFLQTIYGKIMVAQGLLAVMQSPLRELEQSPLMPLSTVRKRIQNFSIQSWEALSTIQTIASNVSEASNILSLETSETSS